MSKPRRLKQTAWTPFRLSETLPSEGHSAPRTVWGNSRYTVIMRQLDGGPLPVIHLSIHRHDREVIRDWRELQRIKNELVGPECEAIEIFPKESKLVDTANEFHLWVFPDPEFTLGLGFDQRLVSEGEGTTRARQRPFEQKPADLLSTKQLEQMARAQGVF